MFIFLYGQDSYMSRQKLNEIIDYFKKISKKELNLKHFDLKKSSFEDFREEIQSNSIFKGKKLIILKNVFFNLEIQKKFLDYFKKISKKGLSDIVLLYEEGIIVEKNFLFKFLKKYGKCQEFKLLDAGGLNNWAKKEFKNYSAEINPKALILLINFVGNDLWRFSNEIKKLASFKNGEKIEEQDIALLVKPKIETNIFKTIDAIALKNKRQALELIHKHLERGDSALYLLSMINFQFRNLLIIKDFIENNKSYNTILREAKLHPYVIKKSYLQANKFTFEKLKKIYQKIFEADLNIKTGRIEPSAALDLLVTEI